jgi:hypothetical protein
MLSLLKGTQAYEACGICVSASAILNYFPTVFHKTWYDHHAI